jgi:N-acetylglucosamine-6-phosphate deacetylase
MIIRGGRVYYHNQFLADHEVVIKDGLITAVQPNSLASADFHLKNDELLVPGFMDLHIHGARGQDVMDANATSLQILSDALLEEGVVGYLATTMTESIPKIEAALKTCFEFQRNQTQGAELLGVHLEGPFLSQAFMGAQCGDHLKIPDIALLKKWQQQFPDLIRLITIAPELPHAIEFIQYARSQNIVVSIGHTAANFAETKCGIDAGATHATHLFNAMSGVHHREPGAAAALLSDDRVIAELIVDGAHVAPEMIQFTVQCKGLDHLLLVTDAMRAKCLKAGIYDLGGQNVAVDDYGIARLQSNGKLAGSTLQLNKALKNMHQYTGLPLTELIPLITIQPASILKILNQGYISSGQIANLVVLNNNFDVKGTFYHGKIVYQCAKSTH